MYLIDDDFYMQIALQLAMSTQGQTQINPVVGCVLVNEGRIVGMGAHLKRGDGHAEIQALQMAGSQAKGSTAYVTLEPCNHHGLTGPCTMQLIKQGVQRVVIAMIDPNPQVAGQGINKLREVGIQVDVGICEAQAQNLNEFFGKYIQTRLPFVTAKIASTLDGRIASKTKDSKWVTGEQAREYVHSMRHQHQAIMVGIGTILADNPELSTRLRVPANQPIRIVVDSQLKIPMTARVLTEQDRQSTLVLTTDKAPSDKIDQLAKSSVDVLICGEGPQVDLTLAMKRLGERGISSILLEGGGRIHGAMLEQHLIDKLVMFFAPKIIGGASSPMSFDFTGFELMNQAIVIDRLTVEQIGSDVCISGYPNYTNNIVN
jgi:diaminohydroxyphosphoribosylaminopyrimidine deaminase/5-amino-6-(5-phosphoribosylamino)uracil reductase